MTGTGPGETRRQMRHPLTGDLTGRLVAEESGSVIPCMAVDVSVSGLRIVLALDLQPGASLLLKIGGRQVPLSVVWCMKDAVRRGYYSCGLMTRSPDDDLQKLFREGAAQP